MKNKGGRPTDWNPELNERLEKFFDQEPYREVEVAHVNKKGEEWFTNEERANDIPFISNFERQEGLSIGLMSKWAKEEDCEEKRPGFIQAYKRAKEVQKQFLIINGTKGLYNPAFAIFTAKNITDMSNVDRLDLTTKGESLNKEEVKKRIENLNAKPKAKG